MQSEDRIAISELLTRYATTIGDCDYEGCVSCFAGEAVIFHGNGHTYRGTEEIRGHFLDFDKRRALLPNSRRFHTDLVIKIDGAQASSVCNVLITVSDEAGPRLEYAGEYRDKLIKRDGQWLILERRYISDAPLRAYKDQVAHGGDSVAKTD